MLWDLFFGILFFICMPFYPLAFYCVYLFVHHLFKLYCSVALYVIAGVMIGLVQSLLDVPATRLKDKGTKQEHYLHDIKDCRNSRPNNSHSYYYVLCDSYA